MEHDQQEEVRQAGKRILAIFAFVVVIAIGVFGSLSLASAVPNAFSGVASAIGSVFGSDEPNVDVTNVEDNTNETLTVSAPQVIVNEGTPFSISWTHKDKNTDGVYTVRFDCSEDITLTSPVRSGSLSCNTSLNVGDTNSASFTADSAKGDSTIDVRFHVEYTPNGETVPTMTDDETITIARTEPTNSGGTTGGIVTTPVTAVSDPNGHIDLSVSLVAVGVVDNTTNQFFTVQNPSRSAFNQRVAVRFEVKNNGTKTSPTWTFTASLPTAQNYVYNSPTQSALRPGESIIYTLAFDSFVNSTSGTVTVNVDPSNYISESNESNNKLIRVIQTNP